MKHLFLFISLTLMSLSACKTKKVSSNIEEVELGTQSEKVQPEKGNTEESSSCLELLDISDFKADQEDLMAGILESKIEGNCLRLTFQYSGCNEGQPLLVKQAPVESKKGFTQNFKLYVRGAGPCEMLLETTESFDISSLQQGPESVSLRINDQKEVQYRAY